MSAHIIERDPVERCGPTSDPVDPAGAQRVVLILSCDREVELSALSRSARAAVAAIYPAEEDGGPGVRVVEGCADEAVAVEAGRPGAHDIWIGLAPRTIGLSLSQALADERTLDLLAAKIIDSEACEMLPATVAAQWLDGFAEERSEAGAEARQWWADHLHPPVRLPFGGEGDGAASHLRRRLPIPPDLSRRVGIEARELGLSREAIWLGCWSLLMRAIADTALTMWVRLDGRSYDGLDRCAGPLARSAPFAWPLEEGGSVAGLLKRVEADLQTGRRHLEYLELSPPCRREIGFRWQAARRIAGRNGAVWTELDRWSTGAPPALWLHVHEGEREPEIVLTAASGEDALDGLGSTYLQVVARACAEPQARWSEALASDVLLRAAPVSADRSLLTDIAAWAAETPDAPALVDEFETLSYAQLWNRAGALAASLAGLGAGPERPIGLLMGRSVGAAVGILAAWRCGAPYLPLDPEHPQGRLRRLAIAARLTAIVADPTSGARVGGLGLPILDPLGSPAVPEACGSEPRPASAAYLMGTSGSTGEPKLVAVEHRQLAAYRDGFVERAGIGTGRRFGLVTGWATDLGMTMIVAALTTGGALHVMPRVCLLQAPAFGAFVRSHGLQVLKTTPGHLSALLGQDGSDQVLPSELLVLGGEASTWQLIRSIAERAPALRVLNHYGPTETTVGAVAGFIDLSEAERHEVPLLGRALPGIEVHVLDEAMRPTRDWVPGEICVGGPGVARGYAGMPSATASAFLPAPGGGRLYRTGDRGRRLPDGRLAFLGRRDFQLKINGYRVDPGETEAMLRALPGVAGAVVVAKAGEGGARLLAYVVPREGATWDPAGWGRLLAEQLPPHLLPANIIRLAAIPLRDNGKADTSRLPPEPSGAHGSLNPLESRIAGAWRELLNLADVGPDDRFFDIGGHSLQMVALHQLLRERLQVELTLLELFNNPTVRAMAALAQGRRVDGVVVAAEHRASRQRAALGTFSRTQRGTRR
jgi:amino acid adenylation domain-containing protein